MSTTDPDAGAAFAAFFAEGWSIGATDPERFFAHFGARMTRDARLIQPLAPEGRGPAGLRALFGPLFDALPDLRGEVLRWGATEDGVIIELELRSEAAGLAWTTLDAIVLHDGLIASRRAHFDPLPLVGQLLRRPRVAVALARSRGGGGAREPVERALTGLAVGRLALGSLARVAPRAATRLFRAGAAASPELDYMNRIFGARALALGGGYLLSEGDARRLWQRLALAVDVSDTVAGAGHLRRGDIPRASALAATALTGAYMLVGATRLAADLAAPGRSGETEPT